MKFISCLVTRSKLRSSALALVDSLSIVRNKILQHTCLKCKTVKYVADGIECPQHIRLSDNVILLLCGSVNKFCENNFILSLIIFIFKL